MANITMAKRFDAPLGAVWDCWADFGNVYQWHPLVSHSRLLGNLDAAVRVGSQRQCDFADGKNWLREEIVDLQPERQIKVDMLEGSLPLRSALVTIQFEAITDTRTRVRLSMDFAPKFGLLGKLMTPLMRRRFTGVFRELLDANAAWVERSAAALKAA